MIRVSKRCAAPAELNSKGYKDEVVSKALLEDQHNKCYICERCVTTDYEVEHLISQKGDSSKVNDWKNLFIACGYCNNKKKNSFDNIQPPDTYNIEDSIEQGVDYENGLAIFRSTDEDKGNQNTIALLERMFNGTGKLRNLREQRFFDEFIEAINCFQEIVAEYLADKSEQHRLAIVDALNIKNEYLGFKYWIVKKNPVLCRTFKNYVVWNKV